MDAQRKIILGLIAGLLWSVLLFWVAVTFVTLPVFALIPTIMSAFLAPGLVMAAMAARLALRRFRDGAMRDGDVPSDSAVTDQRVLSQTGEQIVLALCIWPAAAVILGGHGPGVIVCLGLGLAVARLLFWAGAHLSAPLRIFGFAASFSPTVLVGLWAVWKLISGFQ